MNIVCLGAGAIGGYYAGRLVEANAANVTFIVRQRRQLQLACDGLRVESPHGNFSVPVRAHLATEITAPADVVLLACKAYDLDSAIDTVRPAIGPNTILLPLLNGIPHLARLNAAFGAECVLGGFASIAITMQPDGLIRHLNDWQVITFGEQNGALTDRVARIEAAFRQTRIGAAASGVANIHQKMWEKLVLLATLASATTLMRASIGEIARSPGGKEMMLTLLDRNAAIAARAGHPMPAGFMEQNRALFSNTALPMTASMLRDIEAGGQVESDHIVGYMLAKAREFAIDDTLHAISYLHLKAYEQRRAVLAV